LYSSTKLENKFTGADINLVIGIITELDIFFIPLIRYKSDFENKTKRNDKVTTEIIVKFFTKLEI
tara:strand:- start:622 stop:816 length:195 start_codon:yes stop_codon:yes gene_type:complete